MTSVLGGGKFANGAVSGAFAFLYNDQRHLDTDAVSDRIANRENSMIGNTDYERNDISGTDWGFRSGQTTTFRRWIGQ